MLHLFITEALGADLREVLKDRPEFAGVVAELDAELGPASRALPCDEVPTLSIFYRGKHVDWYHERTADRLYALYEQAREQERQTNESQTPLFAEVAD